MEEEGYKFIENIINDRNLTSDEKKVKLEESIYTRATFYQYIIDNLYLQPDENPNHKIYYIRVNDDTKGIRPANLNRISRENYIDMILDRNIEIDIRDQAKFIKRQGRWKTWQGKYFFCHIIGRAITFYVFKLRQGKYFF